MTLIGQIIFQISNRYEVLVAGDVIITSAAGILRQELSSPRVGDWVEVSPENVIVRILLRQNELVRPRVANVNQVVIVAALTAPHLNLQSLYKLIAVIEHLQLPVVIIFTKADLATNAPLPFEDAAYVQFVIDAREPLSLSLKQCFSAKLSVLVGPSGVGKSTLINALTKHEAQTGVTSRKTQRGKHTTRAARLIPLTDGAGSVIDTPGFSLLNLALSPTDLARSFHDFSTLSLKCKFTNCLHNGAQAQHCAVKKAVEEKQLSAQKYHFYLKLLQEAKGV